MSRSVDLFIACPDPLDGVAQAIATLTGFDVTPDGPGVWIVKDGEVRAVLREHAHPDDTELPLSRYPFAVSAAVPDGVRPQDSAPAALLRQVVHKLQSKPEWMTLMVLDMQYRSGAAPDAAEGGASVPPETSAAREIPA
jgi:hypothetical protein